MEGMQQVTIMEALKAFEQNCAASEKSARTVEFYRQGVKQLVSYLGSDTPVSAVTPLQLLSYKAERAESVQITTLDAYLRAIRVFFDFCCDMRYIAESPCNKSLDVNRRKLSMAQNLPYTKLLDEHDFHTIMTVDAPRYMPRKNVARNRAILAILLTSGIRSSGFCALTPADLYEKRNVIHVRCGKGGKTGDILYSDVAIRAVRAYLDTLQKQPADNEPLFCKATEPGVPYNRTLLTETVQKAVERWTGKHGYRAHSMRHSMANILLRNGMRRADIGELLMHDDDEAPDVTRRYTGSDITRQLQEANAIFNLLV